MFCVLDVEDSDGWHGKPMPKDKVDSIINTIESQIQTNKVLSIQPPTANVPQISTTYIKMPSPPAYKIGDKVLYGLVSLI